MVETETEFWTISPAAKNGVFGRLISLPTINGVVSATINGTGPRTEELASLDLEDVVLEPFRELALVCGQARRARAANCRSG